MPWVPWMESTFQSDVYDGVAASTTTTRASIQLFSWPWWMEIISSCGWTWVPRSSSDAQIFKHSDLRYKIKDDTIGFPESESLVDDGPKVNYFILEDDAFPLKLWLMKPYSKRGMDLNQRVFNYRLSRGSRVVENAFGILMSRFRIFQRPMQPPMVARVVMSCLVLHNLLRIQYPTSQQDDFGAEGQPPIVLEGNDIPHEGRNPEAAKTQRKILRDYFMTDGQVPWQMDRI